MAKKIVLSLIALAMLLIILLVIFIFIDAARPTFPELTPPSTTTPSGTQTSLISDTTIQTYLATMNFAQPNYGGKSFIAFERLGENVSGSQAIEYVWAAFQEYYVKNNQLEKGTGISIPLALFFSDGKPVTFNAPRNGSPYYVDVQKYFPDSIKQQDVFIDTAKHNELVRNLEQQTQIQAGRFFNIQSTQPQESTSTATTSDQ